MNSGDELITAQELADSLSLSVDTIWRYTREKRIPCVEIGNRQYRYNKQKVLKAFSGEMPSSFYRQKRPSTEVKPLSIIWDSALLDFRPGRRLYRGL